MKVCSYIVFSSSLSLSFFSITSGHRSSPLNMLKINSFLGSDGHAAISKSMEVLTNKTKIDFCFYLRYLNI
jgi:hypothetical protein